MHLPIAHYRYQKKLTSLSVHVVQKITIIRDVLEENPQFEISYSTVALSGGAEKFLNMGEQLQTIHYIKPTKLFLNCTA